MDKRMCWASVHGVGKESDMTKWLNNHNKRDIFYGQKEPQINFEISLGNFIADSNRAKIFTAREKIHKDKPKSPESPYNIKYDKYYYEVI